MKQSFATTRTLTIIARESRNAQIRRTLHGILTTHTTRIIIYLHECMHTQPNRMQTTHAHTHTLTAAEATSGPGTPPQAAS